MLYNFQEFPTGSAWGAMISTFELFLILAFSTTVFICYNLFVAQTVKTIFDLRKKAQVVLTERATELTKKLTKILKGDVQELPEKENVIINEQTLSDLLVEKASDADYKLFIEKLTEIVKDLYSNYQFLRQDPQPDDFMSGYFLGFQVFREEYPVEYEYLFRLAIDRGLDDIKINKLFVEALQNGEVLPLGDAIVDPNLSGCSSILQAQEVRVNIVFAPKAYMERKEELIEEKTAEMEKQKKEQQELAIQKDNVVKSARLAEAVINELVDEVAEKHELQELVKQIKESMRYF